jgi:hypothetical protein
MRETQKPMMENIESKVVFFPPALGDADFSFGCPRPRCIIGSGMAGFVK